jgi:hypothetical protein
MDAPAFADAIDQLLTDPPDRGQLAASAEERFGASTAGRRLRTVWEGGPVRAPFLGERVAAPVGTPHPAGRERAR